jgi:hypothetical protein
MKKYKINYLKQIVDEGYPSTFVTVKAKNMAKALSKLHKHLKKKNIDVNSLVSIKIEEEGLFKY